jgi:CheY-like chemotaxis protein
MSLVMVVDDNPVHLEMLSRVATKTVGKDGRVEQFGSALDLLHRICDEGEVPDLLILDYMLPEMDGLQALRILRNRGVNSRVMIVSAYLDQISEKLIPSNNVSTVVNKPYSLVKLAEEIAKSLGMKVEVANGA